MPTRHLSDEQRQRYANFAATPSPDQLAQYFHLDRSDREITDGLRGVTFSDKWRFSSALYGADDQGRARGFDYIVGDRAQAVDAQNALDLDEQAMHGNGQLRPAVLGEQQGGADARHAEQRLQIGRPPAPESVDGRLIRGARCSKRRRGLPGTTSPVTALAGGGGGAASLISPGGPSTPPKCSCGLCSVPYRAIQCRGAAQFATTFACSVSDA